MAFIVERRLRPQDLSPLAWELGELVAERRSDNNVRRAVALLVGAVLLGAALWGSFNLEFTGEDSGARVGLPCGALLFAVVLFTALDRCARVARLGAKVEFLTRLLADLSDDLHPRRKLGLKLDLAPYDAARKLIWRGRSSAGNPKNKFADNWLRLELLLADHTRLRFRQQVGIKTKKGGIVSERRRFFLLVRPGPMCDLPGLLRDLEGERKRLRAAVASQFSNPPEDFHLHAKQDGSELRIDVMQDDAPITAPEVLGLLHGVVLFLARHNRGRAA